MKRRDEIKLWIATGVSIIGVCILIAMPQYAVNNLRETISEKVVRVLYNIFRACGISIEQHFIYIFMFGVIISVIYALVIVENFRIKKIAQALKESKEKYLIATKNANISVWELDIANKRIIQSEHSREVHGNVEVIENVPESIIARGCIIGEEVEKFREMYDKIYAGEPSAAGEFWVKTQGRAVRWYEKITYTTIYDKQGKPVKAIGWSKDITIQKEIEKKYKEEIYNRTCVDTDIVGTFHFNLTQNWCGDGHSDFEEILELQKAETVDGFFEAEYANNVDAEILKEYKAVFNRKNLLKVFYEGNKQLSFDHKYYMKSKNKVIWITTFIFMIQNPDTDDVEGFIYSRDINSSKINEQIMRSVIGLEYDYITVINGSNNTYFLYETNQDRTLPVSGEGNYGEAVEDYAKRFICEEDRNQYIHDSSLEEIIKQLGEDNSYVVYFRVIEPNGKIRWKKSYYAYMDVKDKTIIGTRVDITQIYEREEKKNDLLKNALAAAEQANKAKSVFLSSMSHDIRTPMNAIVGMTKLAMMEIEDKDKVLNSLRIIESSSKHLLAIINDILDMSRIESGKLVFAEEEFDLNILLETIMEMSSPLMDAKNQSFKVTLIGVENTILKGDEIKLKQIIINLLSNANKFTPPDGQIVLTVEETKVTSEGTAYFLFTVEDNGIGIPKADQEAIFNPFYREGIGAINKIEGTGLGLSIVKSMVEARGGRIWVESKVGKGSKFIFEFACTIVNKDETVLEEKDKKRRKKMVDCIGIKILLVEDNEINIMVATQLFEKLGATVTIASNGSIGYDKFVSSKEGDYDIIFMDIQMPVMNGYEATKAIRESKHVQAQTIPIVAMSADVFAEDITKSRAAGMNAHLGKPFEVEDFGEIINNLLLKEKK